MPTERNSVTLPRTPRLGERLKEILMKSRTLLHGAVNVCGLYLGAKGHLSPSIILRLERLEQSNE